jgi:hypothetical protein
MQLRKTFRQTLNETVTDAAEAAWNRAKLASQLRHVAQSQGRRGAARGLAQVKRAAIWQALRLQTGVVRLTLDNDYQVGLLRIRWPGRGRLHLPAGTDTSILAKEPYVTK